MLSHKQAAHADPTMWMVDYKDQVKEISYDAARNRRRFRRLIPKPSHDGAPCSMVAASSPYCSSFYKTDPFSWNSKLTNASNQQQGKEENTEPLVSSRWNPAPEQVMALQEMYERGVRTPSADEIQLIAAKLRQFGKIEGKNVFYWFQNHKARERQKRRRQPDSSPLEHANDMQAPKTKLDIGLRWNVLDAQEKMNSATSLNCNNPLKSSSSMHRAVGRESRTNEWTHLDERENQLQKTIHTKTTKGSSPLLDFSFMPSHLNSTSKTCIPEALCSGEQEQSSAISLDISMLQLFPVRDDDPWRPRGSEEEEKVASTMAAKFAPSKFYEFL